MATLEDEKSMKQHQRRQNIEEETKRQYRSIFELPTKFFDSCRLLPSPFHAISDRDVSTNDAVEESPTQEDSTEHLNSLNGTKTMQRWSCNTCKAEFESLKDQRLHFKSDLHRFNIKLSVAGKVTIKEEDFDESTSDSLCRDYDVSSISGSEDEEEREVNLRANRQHNMGGFSKNKIYIQLQNGEIICVWRCLLLDESENILFEGDKPFTIDRAGVLHLTPRQVMEKLTYILCEPRDSTRLRIVLLARGGHFAGCVFDGNSLVAHKTFHRYVVRAKAGKKQSSKDAGGGAIHSAGASLRRYNELALKKDIREVLTAWKPHFAVASSIFIHAPSNNRQLLFDGEKTFFTCQHRAIRYIPLPVRRPTLKEARRIYGLLVQVLPEKIGEMVNEEIPGNTKGVPLSATELGSRDCNELSQMELGENFGGTETAEASIIVAGPSGLSLSVETEDEIVTVGVSTPLHEAAKSGNSQTVLELLEQGLDPCIKDERGQTPYMLASEKEVRNTFRRFMASNLERWDWSAAKVPSPLTKEMEESQAAKHAEKVAQRKAKAKELKKLKKTKEKKAQAEAAQSEGFGNLQGRPDPTSKGHPWSSSSTTALTEEELKRTHDAEREKRAAAAEKRIAAAAALKVQPGAATVLCNLLSSNTGRSDISCSCCNASLVGKVPFHRYNYKYCSTSCMHAHREILEDDEHFKIISPFCPFLDQFPREKNV